MSHNTDLSKLAAVLDTGTNGQVLTSLGGSSFSFAGAAAGGGSLEATASGTIANGDPVVVNTNGTVSKAASTNTLETSAETETDNTEEQTLIPITGNSDSQNKLILFYKDSGLQARVITVSGTSVNVGTSITTVDTTGGGIINQSHDYGGDGGCWNVAQQKGVFVYGDSNTAGYGPIIKPFHLFSSGTAISADHSNRNTTLIASLEEGSVQSVYDPNIDRIVLVGRSETSGTVQYTTIDQSSGFSISNVVSLAATFNSTSGFGKPKLIYDPDTARIAGIASGVDSGTRYMKWFCFQAASNGLRIGHAAGTLSERSGMSGGSFKLLDMVYDTNSNKAVIFYSEPDGIYGIVTTIPSSGYTLTFENAVKISDEDNPNTQYGNACNAVFSPLDNKIHLEVKAYQSGYVLFYFTCQVSGSTLTTNQLDHTGATVRVADPAARWATLEHQADAQKIVSAYYDNNPASGVEKGRILSYSSTSVSNVTPTNFIGISDGAYANGATATIQTAGAVDDAQSGLTAGTKYYLAADGSLQTSASNPSVEVGVAVSATKLIVKG